VAEAGVYGEPDERWGQRVVAAVVPVPGLMLDEEALIAFCGAHLARYKVPARIRFVATLPRNAAGKLLRRELRAGIAAS
jgi:acyl-CoA synthetase (AMP-forming)/AMP-acid ligase II